MRKIPIILEEGFSKQKHIGDLETEETIIAGDVILSTGKMYEVHRREITETGKLRLIVGKIEMPDRNAK
ncbi:MAG: hypothetical protein GY804_11570 [Alphaproteobacteria bacterium]|nr:hypothetical protein [Alphaproteobacteria bacterium]